IVITRSPALDGADVGLRVVRLVRLGRPSLGRYAARPLLKCIACPGWLLFRRLGLGQSDGRLTRAWRLDAEDLAALLAADVLAAQFLGEGVSGAAAGTGDLNGHPKTPGGNRGSEEAQQRWPGVCSWGREAHLASRSPMVARSGHDCQATPAGNPGDPRLVGASRSVSSTF